MSPTEQQQQTTRKWNWSRIHKTTLPRFKAISGGLWKPHSSNKLSNCRLEKNVLTGAPNDVCDLRTSFYHSRTFQASQVKSGPWTIRRLLVDHCRASTIHSYVKLVRKRWNNHEKARNRAKEDDKMDTRT